MSTRITRSLEALLETTQASLISSVGITQAGFGSTIAMSSEQVIPIGGNRLVDVANISTGAAYVFFQRTTDAVMDKGTALAAGQRVVIPLNEGQSLNAIATTAGVKISGQVYG